jgi:hypothetical protein
MENNNTNTNRHIKINQILFSKVFPTCQFNLEYMLHVRPESKEIRSQRSVGIYMYIFKLLRLTQPMRLRNKI